MFKIVLSNHLLMTIINKKYSVITLENFIFVFILQFFQLFIAEGFAC